MTNAASTPVSMSSISRHPLLWTWIGLLFADVVIWLIADSQGPDLLVFNAQGTFLNVLKVVWCHAVPQVGIEEVRRLHR